MDNAEGDGVAAEGVLFVGNVRENHVHSGGCWAQRHEAMVESIQQPSPDQGRLRIEDSVEGVCFLGNFGKLVKQFDGLQNAWGQHRAGRSFAPAFPAGKAAGRREKRVESWARQMPTH
jgi:hypothetical protein